MIKDGLAILYLIVSAGSTAVQVASLWRLAQWNGSRADLRLVHRGLVRTSVCRVLAAIAYVVFGVVALTSTSAMLVAVVSLILFTVVQLMWQANGLLDVSLRRQLEPPAPPTSETDRGIR